MPGYTHLQRAQPITFAHHLLHLICCNVTSVVSGCLGKADIMPWAQVPLLVLLSLLTVDVAAQLNLQSVLQYMDAVSDRTM